MADQIPDMSPTIQLRVQWWTKHEDGHVHTNHHDHASLELAKADLATCEGVPHIVMATLTQITTFQQVLSTFEREDRAVGGAGVFKDQPQS